MYGLGQIQKKTRNEHCLTKGGVSECKYVSVHDLSILSSMICNAGGIHVRTKKGKLSTLPVDDLARCMIWMMVLSMHAHITKCTLSTSPVDDLARCMIGNDGAIDACTHNKMQTVHLTCGRPGQMFDR